MNRKSRSFFDMQFVTPTISTMLVLLLLGMVVFFMLTANNLSVYVREIISFTALINDVLKETSIIKLQKDLDTKPYVKQTTYISKERALKEQTEAMGTDPSEFLGYNPFSPSIEIKLNAKYAHPDSIKWIEKELMSGKKLVQVTYPQDLLDSVNRNIGKISLILLGFAALLLLISFALINNTIRLAIYAKRFLIHTMKLVGASWGFIRRPFIIRHLWMGLLAATLADLLLVGMAYMAVSYETDLLSIITLNSLMIVIVSVFLFGITITSLCAWISINRYLRMKVDELY